MSLSSFWRNGDLEISGVKELEEDEEAPDENSHSRWLLALWKRRTGSLRGKFGIGNH